MSKRKKTTTYRCSIGRLVFPFFSDRKLTCAVCAEVTANEKSNCKKRRFLWFCMKYLTTFLYLYHTLLMLISMMIFNFHIFKFPLAYRRHSFANRDKITPAWEEFKIGSKNKDYRAALLYEVPIHTYVTFTLSLSHLLLFVRVFYFFLSKKCFIWFFNLTQF